jgi:hypothetical protein
MGDGGKAFMQMLTRKNITTQKMHVMCTTNDGVFQVAHINVIDCTFNLPRMQQLPEEDGPTSESGEAKAPLKPANTNPAARNTSARKEETPQYPSPGIVLGYVGTAMKEMIAKCRREEVQASTFLELVETYLALHHENV